MEKYLKSAKQYGFELLEKYDQTDNTMITLDYAKYFIERFINPAIDYGVYSANKNFPTISKLLGFFAQKKWREKQPMPVKSSHCSAAIAGSVTTPR